MKRRQVLAACGLGLAGVAGCFADDAGDDRSTDTPTTDPTDRDGEHAAEQPDPDLAVRVVNDGEETRSVSLTVTRDSGEVVPEATHEAPPVSDREVYDLRAADPDGVESFEIAAERGDASDSPDQRVRQAYHRQRRRGGPRRHLLGLLTAHTGSTAQNARRSLVPVNIVSIVSRVAVAGVDAVERLAPPLQALAHVAVQRPQRCHI